MFSFCSQKKKATQHEWTNAHLVKLRVHVDVTDGMSYSKRKRLRDEYYAFKIECCSNFAWSFAPVWHEPKMLCQLNWVEESIDVPKLVRCLIIMCMACTMQRKRCMLKLTQWMKCGNSLQCLLAIVFFSILFASIELNYVFLCTYGIVIVTNYSFLVCVVRSVSLNQSVYLLVFIDCIPLCTRCIRYL